MKVDLIELNVNHYPEESRFTIEVGSFLPELKYRLQDNTIIFTHTGVPSELEGQGVGSKLVRAGLEYARERGLKVRAHCSFVAAYLRRHPEYQDLT